MVKKKHQTKSQLVQLKNKYLVEVYTGLSKNQNVRDIQNNLKKITFNQKKQGLAYNEKMLDSVLKSVSILKKKIGSPTFVKGYVQTTYGQKIKDNQELIAIFVYDIIDKYKVEKTLSHDITVFSDKFEADIKDKAIQDTFEENRYLDNPKIFYLASQHRDSASDHKDYQGKVYIDEKWRNFVHNEQQIEDIRQYIIQHDVKTIQWVMGEPVWFITRPNCRHYFKALNVDDVLQNSRRRLLKEHNMTTAIGDREYLQTIKNSRDLPLFDKKRNAQIMVEKYEERLKLHQDMYDSVKNEIIANAIKKDKMLIKKWKDYLK